MPLNRHGAAAETSAEAAPSQPRRILTGGGGWPGGSGGSLKPPDSAWGGSGWGGGPLDPPGELGAVVQRLGPGGWRPADRRRQANRWL
jgi:hypothetical protein